MYSNTNKAHVTPNARTDVFVGHGSKMVTVLSVIGKHYWTNILGFVSLIYREV